MKPYLACAAFVIFVAPVFAQAEVSYTFVLSPSEVVAHKLDASKGHLKLEAQDAAGEFVSNNSLCPRLSLVKGSHGADNAYLILEGQGLAPQDGNVFYRKEGGMGYGTGWDGNPPGQPVDFGPLNETKAEFITPDSINFERTGVPACAYSRVKK
ncbi:MAG: hypothetical protein ACXVB9_06835 [Bdellovibrionota bacterium]